MPENATYVETVFHRLHGTPEPNLMEVETARFLAGELETFGYRVEKGVGGTGVVGILDAGRPGPVLGVRSDMDALVFEINGRKTHIHACGHDANAAMVVSAAKTMAEKGIEKGRLLIIFQPAEETFQGAMRMIESGALDHLEELIGIHLRPVQEMALGEATPAVYHAAARRIRVTIRGKSAHSGTPHLGINTVEAAVLAVNAVNSLKFDPLVPHSAKVTTIRSAGTAHNIIPETTELVFDLRAQQNGTLKEMIAGVTRAIENGVRAVGAEPMLKDVSGAPAAVYDDGMIRLAESAISEVLGEVRAPVVHPGSEDFHCFAQILGVKSVYVGIGADLSPGLHHPEMTFDLSALTHGRKILETMISKRLRETRD